MSYYDIQVSANLHRPIKSNQVAAPIVRGGEGTPGSRGQWGGEGVPLGDAFKKLHRS